MREEREERCGREGVRVTEMELSGEKTEEERGKWG